MNISGLESKKLQYDSSLITHNVDEQIFGTGSNHLSVMTETQGTYWPTKR